MRFTRKLEMKPAPVPATESAVTTPTVSTGSRVPEVRQDRPVVANLSSGYSINNELPELSREPEPVDPEAKPVVANCAIGEYGLTPQAPTTATVFDRDAYDRRDVPAGPAVARPQSDALRSR